MEPVEYLEYRDFNPIRKNASGKSIKKYNVYRLCAALAYEERQGGWETVERKVTNYIGFKGFKKFKKEVKIKDKNGNEKTVRAQGFCAWDDKRFMVSYCGTNDFKDWMRNLDIEHVDMKDKWGFDCDIHDGFYTYMMALWKDILEVYEKHGKGKKLCLTGHSLGGAAILLFAMKMFYEKGITPWNVFTFGQPAVIDKKGAEKVAKDLGHVIYRCQFGCDAVARLNKKDRWYLFGIIWMYHLPNVFIFISSSGEFSNKNKFGKRFWGRMKGFLTGRLIFKQTTTGVMHHDVDERYGEVTMKKNEHYL